MKLALACDHGALTLKQKVRQHLEAQGHTVVDFGTNTPDSCDYADFGIPAAKAVASGECDRGIVLCTTGIGMSMSANKVKGIRCALCADSVTAEMTRRHNNSNMLAMGAGVVGPLLAERIVDTFLNTEFEGGRHERRVNLMMDIENG